MRRRFEREAKVSASGRSVFNGKGMQMLEVDAEAVKGNQEGQAELAQIKTCLKA